MLPCLILCDAVRWLINRYTRVIACNGLECLHALSAWANLSPGLLVPASCCAQCARCHAVLPGQTPGPVHPTKPQNPSLAKQEPERQQHLLCVWVSPVGERRLAERYAELYITVKINPTKP